jgi:hypothetical protein
MGSDHPHCGGKGEVVERASLKPYERCGKNREENVTRGLPFLFGDGDAIEDMGARCSGVLIFLLLGEDTP